MNYAIMTSINYTNQWGATCFFLQTFNYEHINSLVKWAMCSETAFCYSHLIWYLTDLGLGRLDKVKFNKLSPMKIPVAFSRQILLHLAENHNWAYTVTLFLWRSPLRLIQVHLQDHYGMINIQINKDKATHKKCFIQTAIIQIKFHLNNC